MKDWNHALRRFGGWVVASGALALTMMWTPVAAGADGDAETVLEALSGGMTKLHLRYRAEWVTDDGAAVKDNDAIASTIRTALGYRTLPYQGVSAFVMFEDVTVAGRQLYNNKGTGQLSNGITHRPVVADPAITSINQAYLDVTSIPETRIRFGRDELAFDDQRFVGPVAWRQHHQSFDAVSVKNTSIPNVALTYAYLWNVSRIFGDHTRMNSHLVNANYKPDPRIHLAGFYYLLDYDQMAFEGLSRATVGGRVTGQLKVEDWTVPYEGSFANQTDVDDNPVDVDVFYYKAEVGVASPAKVGARVGYEVQEGSADIGQFQTPLATGHKFNGFADRFLATPLNGLQDIYAQLNGKSGAFQWVGTYHWFKANEGDAEYGTELDLLATYKTEWGPVVGFKGAIYNADTFSVDAQKFMLWIAHGVR